MSGRNWRGAALSASTVDLNEQLTWAGRTVSLRSFITEGLAKIPGLPADQHNRAVAIIFDGLRQRLPARDVARAFRTVCPSTQREAIDVVSFQLSRIAALLDSERQRQAGISRFTWRWSGALDENPEHCRRDGQVFEWDHPMESGHAISPEDLPGMAPDCKCRAQAWIDLS